VKADINREIELEELRKMRDSMQQAASNFESSVHSEMNKTESELNKSVEELNKPVEAAAAGKPAEPPTAQPAGPQAQAAAAEPKAEEKKPAPKPEQPKPVQRKPPAPVPQAPVDSQPQQAAPAAATAPRVVSASQLGFLVAPNTIYPARSRKAGEQGSVMVRVFVDVAGRPAQVTLETSSGHSTLDEAALTAVRGAQFRPYSEGGVPKTVWVRVPINFVLQ